MQSHVNEQKISSQTRMPQLNETVIPIFKDDKNNMKPEGSGVLLQISDQFFILTAAHVLDAGELYIPDQEGLVMLNGHKDSSDAPNGKRELDRVDVGYVHLQPEIVKHIKAPHCFLPVSLIDVNHISQEEQHYMFMGYPNNAVKRKFGTKAFKSKLTTFTDKLASQNTYNGVAANQADHIVINFDSKKAKDSDENQITPPKMTGMSGGGVWCITKNDSIEGIPDARLCAIGIEYHTKKHKCLVGTKIAHVLELIRKNYPQLSAHIPATGKHRE
jgi:hypothetical protein